MTLRDKPINEQIQWLAGYALANTEYEPKIRPAMRDIAILCAEQYVSSENGRIHKDFLDQLKQYVGDPTPKLWNEITYRPYNHHRGAIIGDAASVVTERHDYAATMDAGVTVHSAQKYGLDLTHVKSRMNSLLDELGL